MGMFENGNKMLVPRTKAKRCAIHSIHPAVLQYLNVPVYLLKKALFERGQSIFVENKIKLILSNKKLMNIYLNILCSCLKWIDTC